MLFESTIENQRLRGYTLRDWQVTHAVVPIPHVLQGESSYLRIETIVAVFDLVPKD